MHLFSTTFLLYLHGLLLALVALGSADSDVDFMSVRAKFLKDYSGKGGEPGEKYFSKCPFSVSALVLSLTQMETYIFLFFAQR
jgi:hypothetical protein